MFGRQRRYRPKPMIQRSLHDRWTDFRHDQFAWAIIFALGALSVFLVPAAKLWRAVFGDNQLRPH